MSGNVKIEVIDISSDEEDSIPATEALEFTNQTDPTQFPSVHDDIKLGSLITNPQRPLTKIQETINNLLNRFDDLTDTLRGCHSYMTVGQKIRWSELLNIGSRELGESISNSVEKKVEIWPYAGKLDSRESNDNTEVRTKMGAETEARVRIEANLRVEAKARSRERAEARARIETKLRAEARQRIGSEDRAESRERLEPVRKYEPTSSWPQLSRFVPSDNRYEPNQNNYERPQPNRYRFVRVRSHRRRITTRRRTTTRKPATNTTQRPTTTATKPKITVKREATYSGPKQVKNKSVQKPFIKKEK